MAGYLEYWCSLDITGTAERDILTSQLETEFDNVDRMVDVLIEAREERRREIAREVASIEARLLYVYLCHYRCIVFSPDLVVLLTMMKLLPKT